MPGPVLEVPVPLLILRRVNTAGRIGEVRGNKERVGRRNAGQGPAAAEPGDKRRVGARSGCRLVAGHIWRAESRPDGKWVVNRRIIHEAVYDSRGEHICE